MRRQQSRSRSMVSVTTWAASGSSAHSSCCWLLPKCSRRSRSHNRFFSRGLTVPPTFPRGVVSRERGRRLASIVPRLSQSGRIGPQKLLSVEVKENQESHVIQHVVAGPAI